MPRATHAYGFEMKVAGFAGELGARFAAGESPRPFVLELDRGGSVTSLSFDDGSQEWRSRGGHVEALSGFNPDGFINQRLPLRPPRPAGAAVASSSSSGIASSGRCR